MKRSASLSLFAVAALAVQGFSSAQNAFAQDGARRWNFDNPREIISAYNIDNAKFENGEYSGRTKYDPYFSLALPEGGLDANFLTILKTRFYSSAPADALAIYYRAPGGDWALGAGPAIKEGWNEFTLDLDKDINWKNGEAGATDKNNDAARLWGGREKRVVSLRLDPGNQPDRDLKFDYVAIEAVPGAVAPTAQNAPIPAGQTSWIFDRAGDFQGWTGGQFERLEATASGLRGLTKYDPALLSPETHIDAKAFPVFEFKAKSDIGGGGEIFFRHDDESFNETRMAVHSLIGDNEWHTYRIDMSKLPGWSGDVRQLRFDPLNPGGASLEVAWIRLATADDESNLLRNASFETPGDGTLLDEWTSEANGLQLRRDAGNLSIEGSGNATLSQGGIDLLATGTQTLSIEYSLPRGSAEVEMEAQFFDVFDKPLSSEKRVLKAETTAQNKVYETNFVAPPHAASQKITMRVHGTNAQMALHRVALKSLQAPNAIGFDSVAEPAKDEEGRPLWRASWIMPKAVTGNALPRLFRRTFEVNDLASIESARVLITGDNTARLSVNGTELPAGPFVSEWREPDIYDIKSLLKDGRNVLGILTTNEGSSEGVIAEMGLRRRDGSAVEVLTDASWKALESAPPANWSGVDFNDASWQAANVVAVAGAQPWGALPYTYLGAVAPLEISDYKFLARGKSGDTGQFSATLTPRALPTRPLDMVLELVSPKDPKNSLVLLRHELDTKSWKAGTPVKIGPLPVSLPRFASAGAYTLRVRVPYANLQTVSTQNTNTGLVARGDWLETPLQMDASPAPASPVARVKYLHDGQVPGFEINGKTIPVMHHMEMEYVKNSSIDNIRAAGVPLIWWSLGDGIGWNPDGKHDFSAMDRELVRLLRRYPNAYIVINLPYDPVYNKAMREKWLALNPTELAKDDKGGTDIGAYNGAINKVQSYASKKWMSDAVQAIRATVRHVRSSPYADRIIGYVPISGISWEWFYWGAQSQEFLDYSEPFRKGFAEYSKTKYGTIAKLNAAWKTSYSAFNDIKIPTREERLKTSWGTFLDPQNDAAVITLREYFSQVISGDILEQCRAIKEETKNTALTGTYYGYVNYVAGPYIGNHTGHFALGRVLNSPHIDFLMSPARYDDRGIGGGSGFMTNVDSIKKHGKVYIDQADLRTAYATGPGGVVGRTGTVRESSATLMREAANTFVNGVAPQWYDFGLGWTTGDLRLMDTVKRAREIGEELQNVPRKTMDGRNSIAFITDEKSVKYTGLTSRLHDITANYQIQALHRTGVGVDQYSLDDLETMPPYKVYLFANTFRISEAQRRFIETNLKKNGNTLVWVYAPGILSGEKDGDKLDLNRVSQLVGITLKADMQGTIGALQRVSRDKLMDGMAADAVYGTPIAEGPQIYTDDESAELLAAFTETKNAGAVVKRFPTWTSVYSGAAPLPPKLLQNIARASGIPVVNESVTDITYVSDRVFSVHTYNGGARTFSVPVKNGTVKELVRGENYPIVDGKFTCTLPAQSTSIFLYPAS